MALFMLGYHAICPQTVFWHGCFFAEDLSEREMQTLRQAMENEFGYYEDLGNEEHAFDFSIFGYLDDPATFVRLRSEWEDFVQTPNLCHNRNDVDMLQSQAAVYADIIRQSRKHAPLGVFVLTDFGKGEGEVCNYVVCLTADEVDMLYKILEREVHEAGGLLEIVNAEEVAVENPAYYILLKRQWEDFQKELEKPDGKREGRHIEHRVTAHYLSLDIIEDIDEWRETVAGRCEAEQTSPPESTATEERGPDQECPHASLFIPMPLQKEILKALEGKALKKQQLADMVCKGEGTVLYRPGGIKELRNLGLVQHKRGIGFYRPDSPPPGSIKPN